MRSADRMRKKMYICFVGGEARFLRKPQDGRVGRRGQGQFYTFSLLIIRLFTFRVKRVRSPCQPRGWVARPRYSTAPRVWTSTLSVVR